MQKQLPTVEDELKEVGQLQEVGTEKPSELDGLIAAKEFILSKFLWTETYPATVHEELNQLSEEISELHLVRAVEKLVNHFQGSKLDAAIWIETMLESEK